MNNRWKYLLVVMALILLVTFLVPTPGKAQGIIYGNRIPKGQVVDHNVILYGNNIAIDGTVNGDVLAFGQDITVNGEVNGTMLTVGENIDINGQIANNLLAGAILMQLGSESKIGRDLYFAGVRLVLPQGSTIERDLYLVSLEAQLAGEVGGDITAIIGPVQIVQMFFIPLFERIRTAIGAVQQGTMVQANVPLMAGIGAVGLNPASNYQTIEPMTGQQATQIDWERIQSWGLGLLKNLIALLILGLLGVWLVPTPLSVAASKVQQSPWRMALSGFVVYVGGWFFAVLAFILILVLAIFFLSLSFTNLGFLVGMLGLTSVGLWVSVLWLSITYISKIVVAILIGRLLLKRIAPRQAESRVWSLILGVVLYALAASIPYLGWVIATLVTFFGLGGLWAVSIPSPRKKRKEALESPSDLSETEVMEESSAQPETESAGEPTIEPAPDPAVEPPAELLAEPPAESPAEPPE
jgi:hypothetical protein